MVRDHVTVEEKVKKSYTLTKGLENGDTSNKTFLLQFYLGGEDGKTIH